jgi:ketosteroid isomerase-like protein
VSADRAALLREGFERINQGDLDGFMTLLHEDVEWTEQMLPEEKRVFHGHEGVRQWFEHVTEAFTWGRFDLISYEDQGDDAVAEVFVNTTGIESGVPVAVRVFQVIRFRDGKIATITALPDRDEARRAAGLG